MQRIDLRVSGINALFDFIKTIYPWEDIEDDGTTIKLWINDKTYIYNAASTLSVGGNVTLSTTMSFTNTDVIIYYDNNTIVITPHSVSNAIAIAIGIAKDFNGEKSKALCLITANSNYLVFYTDNTYTSYSNNANITNSFLQTQLIPLCSITSDHYFKDIYRVFIDTMSNRKGVSVLNDKTYFFASGIAIPIS